MTRRVLAAGCTTLLLGVAGCGGGDGDSAGATSADDGSGGSAPSHEAVLACLKKEGLDAKDQSSSSGPKVGIDYPGGRLLVTFEDTPEDAEAYASVAKGTGETAVVKGSVAITVPGDPGAESAQPAVERCVESP